MDKKITRESITAAIAIGINQALEQTQFHKREGVTTRQIDALKEILRVNLLDEFKQYFLAAEISKDDARLIVTGVLDAQLGA